MQHQKGYLETYLVVHPAWPLEKLDALLQAQAESAASCAMAAACMLQAIGSAMSRAQFWRSYIGPAMPHLITVLALIIPRQPQLAAKVAPSRSIQQWQKEKLHMQLHVHLSAETCLWLSTAELRLACVLALCHCITQ